MKIGFFLLRPLQHNVSPTYFETVRNTEGEPNWGHLEEGVNHTGEANTFLLEPLDDEDGLGDGNAPQDGNAVGSEQDSVKSEQEAEDTNVYVLLP